MTKAEFREVIDTLTTIRDALKQGDKLRHYLTKKYPSETLACEGLTQKQKDRAQALSQEIEDLWSERKEVQT